MNEELDLTLPEKLHLIKAIEHWQKKRWKRLRFWHGLSLEMGVRHMFMQKEIDLIRSQKKRLTALKNSLSQ